MQRLLPLMAAILLLLVPLAAPLPVAAAPAAQVQTTYFFAEGSTKPPFQTWLLVFNPNSSTATVTVSFLSDGVATSRTFSVGANARFSLFANEVLPNADFGMRIESTLPVVAERAMYFRQDGTVVKGIPAPSTTWLFGEGATGFPHETWFLMLNPNAVPASVTLAFAIEGGAPQTTTLTIAPLSRATVFANLILPPAAFSTRITSNQPIVAERSMFRADTGGGNAAEGATAPASGWFFAEGSSRPPFDTWFLIFNPNPNPVRILGRLFLDVGGPGRLLDFNVPANSRIGLFANQLQPNANFGATIASEGGPIVVERSMFFEGASTSTLGAAALATEWFLAEGSTAFPFQEWIHMVNPSGRDVANATLTFFFPDGTSTTRNVVVGGEGRTSLFIDLFLPQTAVSTRVTSDLPIVVERSMFFSGGLGGTNAVGISR